MSGGTLWEWTHRVLAFSLAPLIAAVCVVAWRSRDRSSPAAVTSGVVGALFLIQIALGAATVRLDNTPLSVVLHWGTAMAVIAALTSVAIFAHVSESGTTRGTSPSLRIVPVMLGVTAVVAFITMCVGAYVSSSGAGLACLSLPGCAGNVVVYTPGQIVQMLHRVAAAATLLCASIAFALTWTRGIAPHVRLAASAGILLVFIQVILGLLNVALRLPPDLRELHAANAALVFLAFVTATVFAAIGSYAPSAAAYEGPR